jgi:hypothetical protein
MSLDVRVRLEREVRHVTELLMDTPVIRHEGVPQHVDYGAIAGLYVQARTIYHLLHLTVAAHGTIPTPDVVAEIVLEKLDPNKTLSFVLRHRVTVYIRTIIARDLARACSNVELHFANANLEAANDDYGDFPPGA